MNQVWASLATIENVVAEICPPNKVLIIDNALIKSPPIDWEMSALLFVFMILTVFAMINLRRFLIFFLTLHQNCFSFCNCGIIQRIQNVGTEILFRNNKGAAPVPPPRPSRII